jgi:hypothetical protein
LRVGIRRAETAGGDTLEAYVSAGGLEAGPPLEYFAIRTEGFTTSMYAPPVFRPGVDYHIEVHSRPRNPAVTTAGRFELTTALIDETTETAATNLLVGDSVLTEQLDFAGDVDQFTIVGAPGQRVSIHATRTNTFGSWQYEVFDPVTGNTLVKDFVGNATSPTSFNLNASGRAVVEIVEYCTLTFCTPVVTSGAYKVVVKAI